MGVSTFFETLKFDYDLNKKKFIDNMDFLRSMSNEEHTLYKKWKEVQEFSNYIDKSSVVKANIWLPTNILDLSSTLNDIEKLDPEIIYVPPTNKELMEVWLILRLFIHSMEFEQNPGRFMRFLIRDRNSGRYLGVTSIGSDVISITCRDGWIGWNEQNKLKDGKIRHSAIATTIVPTQPFGFNFLGGKLIASLMCEPIVRNTWTETYGDVLVGLTTTSLYGKHSMYQRIPYWKELGETTGRITLKPDDDVYEIWHHWIKENNSEIYKHKVTGSGEGPATGVKQKILVLIMRELQMKQSTYIHGFQRGVYYAPFYENTKEFLRGEIGESNLVLSSKLNQGIEGILNWWKPKATSRYKTLLGDNRINPEILYYNKMIGESWDVSKHKYLSEVGR